VLDESAVLEPRGEYLASDGVRERDVGADVEAEPAVRPSRARRAARIDDVQFGAPAKRAQNVMKEDRMRVARIRAP